jgi:hypothetical protein
MSAKEITPWAYHGARFLDCASFRKLREVSMVKRARTRWWAVGIAVLAGAGGVTTLALGDDRTTTASSIDELDRDTVHKDAIAANVKRAKEAVERAIRLRAAGDEGHARLADGLAREEAEGALDLARAIDAEKAASEAQQAATDAGVTGDRERALLEEGIARNGRLRAELDELTHPRSETTRSATTDAGAKTSAKPSVTADGGAR